MRPLSAAKLEDLNEGVEQRGASASGGFITGSEPRAMGHHPWRW
jgi:hypothetical protein